MTLKSILDILVVIKFSSNYLKRILLNNSAAIGADIEVFPSGRCWLYFVTCFVARVEAGRIRCVAANAMPCVMVVFFVSDKFCLNHVNVNLA
jgi:hypothetical protein